MNSQKSGGYFDSYVYFEIEDVCSLEETELGSEMTSSHASCNIQMAPKAESIVVKTGRTWNTSQNVYYVTSGMTTNVVGMAVFDNETGVIASAPHGYYLMKVFKPSQSKILNGMTVTTYPLEWYRVLPDRSYIYAGKGSYTDISFRDDQGNTLTEQEVEERLKRDDIETNLVVETDSGEWDFAKEDANLAKATRDYAEKLYKVRWSKAFKEFQKQEAELAELRRQEKSDRRDQLIAELNRKLNTQSIVLGSLERTGASGLANQFKAASNQNSGGTLHQYAEYVEAINNQVTASNSSMSEVTEPGLVWGFNAITKRWELMPGRVQGEAK